MYGTFLLCCVLPFVLPDVMQMLCRHVREFEAVTKRWFEACEGQGCDLRKQRAALSCLRRRSDRDVVSSVAPLDVSLHEDLTKTAAVRSLWRQSRRIKLLCCFPARLFLLALGRSQLRASYRSRVVTSFKVKGSVKGQNKRRKAGTALPCIVASWHSAGVISESILQQ